MTFHPNSSPKAKLPPILLAGIVLLFSLAVTFALWRNAELMARNGLQREFEFRVREANERIVQRMATYRQVLRGAKGLALGSLDIPRETFSAYVDALRFDEAYPGIQGIGIAEVVPSEEKTRHVARIRSQGFPDYSISPAGDRPFYTAITQIEPFDTMNRRAFGFDMFSEPVRRAAMEKARDSGHAAVSGKVTLVQEGKTDIQSGFLMYLPVYRHGKPIETLEERRANLAGWVYAPFRMNDLMTGLGGERAADLDIDIYDGTTASRENCLYGCDADEPAPLFDSVKTLTIVDHPWTVDIRATPGFAARMNRETPKVIAVAGIGVSLLLSMLVWILASGRSRAIMLARKMTDDLRTSELRWRYALEGAGDGVWDWDVQTGDVIYSRRWKAMLGYEEGDIRNDVAEWERLIHPDDKENAVRAARDYLEGKSDTYSHESRLRCKDGSWKWVLSRGMVVRRTDDGKPLRFIGTHTDISARKEAEEREAQRQKTLEQTRVALQRSQRLEAVGKLTGGVAHDFNNVLQIISGNIQLLLNGIGREDQRESRLQSAMNAVDRGAKLSSQLLAFARRQPLEPAVLNIRRIAQNMDELLQQVLGETIEIETVVADDLWNTLVDASRLENVILNLAINARDAMKAGGKLTIELRNAVLDEDYVRGIPDLPAGDYVMLAVSDTGVGMTPDVLERAFEPFFTTKPEGEGTGLGLSMAYGFVRQSGGHIQIQSEAGHGTTVKIYLPRSFEAEDEISDKPVSSIIGGTETILVVEDDIAVQDTVVAMLAELGYQVMRADNAESALAIIRSGMPIDLLFTDVVMPGSLKSTDMATQAKSILPHLAVLFTSGYTQNAIVHGGRLDHGLHLLSKPYRREQLAWKIRQVLDAEQRFHAMRHMSRAHGRPPARP